MRFIGIDVHRDFCEIASHQAGITQSIGRINTTREDRQALADSLGPDDWVALETTGNARRGRRDPRRERRWRDGRRHPQPAGNHSRQAITTAARQEEPRAALLTDQTHRPQLQASQFPHQRSDRRRSKPASASSSASVTAGKCGSSTNLASV